MEKIGITESGEVAFNLDCFNRLHKANIIITKRLTDDLISELLNHKDECILHLTVTGYGGSVVEPNTPTSDWSKNQFSKLINGGFPIKNAVLRLDPVIPTKKGIETALSVMDKFSQYKIKRLRISFLDMYKHVKQRFSENGLPVPYESFHASFDVRKEALNILTERAEKYEMPVEVCGEPGLESIPCISQKDLEILGLSEEITLSGKKNQRSSCSCPENKTELLRQKPHRCQNNCLYCFWKDNNVK